MKFLWTVMFNLENSCITFYSVIYPHLFQYVKNYFNWRFRMYAMAISGLYIPGLFSVGARNVLPEFLRRGGPSSLGAQVSRRTGKRPHHCRACNSDHDAHQEVIGLCLPHFIKKGSDNCKVVFLSWRCFRFLLILFAYSFKKCIFLIKYCSHLKRNVRLSVFLLVGGQWFILRNIITTQWD